MVSLNPTYVRNVELQEAEKELCKCLLMNVGRFKSGGVAATEACLVICQDRKVTKKSAALEVGEGRSAAYRGKSLCVFLNSEERRLGEIFRHWQGRLLLVKATQIEPRRRKSPRRVWTS